MNKFILEQLLIIPLARYLDEDMKIGGRTAEELVRRDALRLTYTAHDLDAFGQHERVNRGPFNWDENERGRLQARLDALFFRLYGFTKEDDIRYILDSFSIVKKRDEEKHGTYLTRDLILDYLEEFKNGNLDP